MTEFSKLLMQYLPSIITTVFGAILGLSMAFKKIFNLSNLFEKATNTSKDISEKTIEKLEKLLENANAIIEKYKDQSEKIETMTNDVEAIKKAQYLIAINDKDLVSKGVAKEVDEVLNYEKKEL